MENVAKTVCADKREKRHQSNQLLLLRDYITMPSRYSENFPYLFTKKELPSNAWNHEEV
jgi:hypothetical protein